MQQFKDNKVIQTTATYKGSQTKVLMIPQVDDANVEVDETLVENLQVHTNLRLESEQESSLNDAKASKQLKVILTRVSEDSQYVHIRLADNMNFYVFWIAEARSEHYEVCVGQLSCYIQEERKLWTLNKDRTISPSNYLDWIIGIDETVKGNEAANAHSLTLKLIQKEQVTPKAENEIVPEPVYFTSFYLPEYV